MGWEAEAELSSIAWATCTRSGHSTYRFFVARAIDRSRDGPGGGEGRASCNTWYHVVTSQAFSGGRQGREKHGASSRGEEVNPCYYRYRGCRSDSGTLHVRKLFPPFPLVRRNVMPREEEALRWWDDSSENAIHQRELNGASSQAHKRDQH